MYSKHLVGWVALVIVVLSAAPAYGHARLTSSEPAAGSTVVDVPQQIVLQFSEELESNFGGVQLFDASGARIPAGEPEIAGSVVRVALGQLPGPGDYTIAYRIISGDSHPIESRLAFSYVVAPPGSLPEQSGTTAPAVPPQPVNVQLEGVGEGSTPGLFVARLVNYLSLTLIVGLLLAGTALLRDEKERREAFGMAAEMSLVWALSGVLLFALALSVAAATGLPGILKDNLIEQFAETRFGKAVLLQVGLALAVALTAYLVGRGRGKVAGVLCLVLVGIALLTPALWGHAGTSGNPALAVASDWAHLVSVTSWVGGLAVLALFVLRPSSVSDLKYSAVRYSKVAGLAIGVVLISGTLNALTRIDSLDLLFSTRWGRLVLLKFGLFAVIALLGLKNRNRMVPAIVADPAGGRKPFRKMAAVELAVMMLSFGAATSLVSSIPSDAEAAATRAVEAAGAGAGVQ
ncbi:MAG: copper resistance CopC/CopD family protein [Actinomycetota bacterium]